MARYSRRRWRQKKKQTKKKLLNMRNKDLFIWDLNKIMEGVEDQSLAEPMAATIYSKASRMGIDDAADYVDSMQEEGALDEERAQRIKSLLNRNTRRR
jgi:hypothetical protein